MTSIQHHVMSQSHSSTNQLDNHLDALLDDLQTSVSRPGTSMALTTHNGPFINGSAFGGQVNLPPGATGYREVTTTVTRENNGIPVTSRDYQIEYLNPANSITVLDERSSSPALDLLKGKELAGHQLKSYKTEMYDYKYSKTTTDRKTSGYGTPQIGESDTKAISMETKSYHQDEPQIQDNSYHSRADNFKGETKVSKNLNELDMLLKELNNTPPTGGMGESMGSSKREHIQTVEIENSPGRYNDSPSTMPKRSASATRETYTERTESRSNRAQSPAAPSGTPKAPARTINVQREYNTMESRSHTSRRDSPSTPTLRRRTPSPSSGEFRPSNFSNYPISPKDLTPTRTVTSKSYSYSSTGRRTPTPTTFADEPQPYRSPSPVSFPQKRSPSPVRKNLNRSDSGRSVSYQVNTNVSPPMSESPTVITYKYSSHSREQSRYPGGGYDMRDQEETATRPFPASTPTPAGEQSPPKKLDELMASFQDSKTRTGNEYSQKSNEYRHNVEYSRESHERQGGDLQRSPSFERNLRPSNVRVTQTYATQQQQQQNQDYQNQYQHREQYQQNQYQQNQYQQREQPQGGYHREGSYQRKEEYQVREHPSQYQQQQNREQYQQNQYQQNQYQQREQPQGGYHREGSYQRKEEYQVREHPSQYQQQQNREQYQQNREQYQQSQYQQYHQSQSGYHQEHREQYQQNQGQYNQSQQYQYQQQYQQNSSPIPVNESMSSSQAHRATSATRSVAGPPVYYPPGVELFTKKEEAMLMQEQSGGKDKSKGKSKSKYEKSEKGKDKGKKMSGVPVCLPVCCAMPCSIM